jgi:cytochrome c
MIVWRALLTAALLALPVSHGGAAEQGDTDRGAQIYKKCQSCHAVGKGAGNGVGPHLNELFGRKAASVEGYAYSEDLARAGADGLVWTADKLHIYIDNPKSLVTRTRMNFGGIKDETERTDLLAYLRTFSASPRDIPEAEPTATPRDPIVDPAILAIAGDREWGEYLSSECKTCHKADGADDGIPSITGWPADVFVIVMHAYKNKARPHPVMQMMAGRLSDEEIAGLAAYFEDLE